MNFKILKFNHLLNLLGSLFFQISDKLHQINFYQINFLNLYTFDNNQQLYFKDAILVKAICYIPKIRLPIKNLKIKIETL